MPGVRSHVRAEGLTVVPCSVEAARHAVMTWHYSHKMPSGKLVKHGVWEDGRFIGVVLYGRGANNHLAQAYGLDQTEACELVRVALRDHKAHVTQIVAASIKLLKASNPGLRLIISYADPEQGHVGGIYQGGNWVYTGKSQAQSELIVNGVFMHKRSVSAKYGTASIPALRARGLRVEPSLVYWKYRYLYPLDRNMRRKIEPLARPYPRGRSVEGDMPVLRAGEAGSTPADRSTVT